MRETDRRTLLKGIGATTLPLVSGRAAAAAGGTASGVTTGSPEQDQTVTARLMAPDLFPDVDTIRRWHERSAELLPRPTASPDSHAFHDWIESQLSEMNAVQDATIERSGYEIHRQLESSASLTVRSGTGSPESIRVVRGIPYTQATQGGGVTGPLVYLPPGTDISNADVDGKIVLRDFQEVNVPGAVFYGNSYYVHDPGATMTPADDYERGYLWTFTINQEIVKARRNGATGIVFAHLYPHEQRTDHYRPYQAIHFDIPGLQVGVDEGARLKQLLEANDEVTANVRLDASKQYAKAPILEAKIPGYSPEEIVIATHSDGPTPLEENGPLVLLALANYFSESYFTGHADGGLSRSLRFVFLDSHMYGSLPARRHAKETSARYERGEVDLVIAPEHFGSREWVATSRDGPGKRLEMTGLPEPWGIFVNPSAPMIEGLAQRMIDFDLRRSFLLRGLLPDADVPPMQYANEGAFYHENGLPTVSPIAGPKTLYDAGGVGIREIDMGYFRRQAMALADFIHYVDELPRQAIAGGTTAYRAMMEHGLDPKGVYP